MPSYNKAILIGNLVADPELKQTPSGKKVTTFNIGVARRFKMNGQSVTDYFQIVAWDKTAEAVCKYYKKGSCIIVTGALQTRTYDDAYGQKHKVTEVYAENVDFGEKKSIPSAEYKADVSFGDAEGGASHYEEMSPDDGLPF